MTETTGPTPTGPRPTGPTPTGPKPQPRPSRLVDDVWFRIGVVAGVVGALLLVTHYFEPFLAWRAAA